MTRTIGAGSADVGVGRVIGWDGREGSIAASGRHVLVATHHAKSVLRAAAGELSERHDVVDDFPSYEMINAAPFRGMFFDPDMRTVSRSGVDFVMSHLFSRMTSPDTVRSSGSDERHADPVCDDAALAPFAGR